MHRSHNQTGGWNIPLSALGGGEGRGEVGGAPQSRTAELPTSPSRRRPRRAPPSPPASGRRGARGEGADVPICGVTHLTLPRFRRGSLPLPPKAGGEGVFGRFLPVTRCSNAVHHEPGSEGVSRFFGADSVPSSRQDRGLSFVSGWGRLDVATGGPVGGYEVCRLSLLPPSGPRFRSLLRLRGRSGFCLLNSWLMAMRSAIFWMRTRFFSLFSGRLVPQLRSIAWRFRTSSGTTSRVASWVAVSLTLGAWPASSASFQRSAQRHQQSPGSRPGKPNSGTAVERSLPAALENARNAASTFVHTVCSPKSSGPVLQLPSR